MQPPAMDLSSSTSDNQFLESQPLLPVHVVHHPIHITFKEKFARANFLPRKLHLPSKSAVLILFWSLLVGAIYMTAKEGTHLAAKLFVQEKGLEDFQSYGILLSRLVFVLVFLLYPFSGFLADICYGRYRIIMVSLILFTCGMAFLSIDSIFLITKYTVTPFSTNRRGEVTPFFIFAACGLCLLITGFAGYEANFIQFGIDQLTDAPSEYLGLFVHWVEWFTMLGTTFAQISFSLINYCDRNESSIIYFMTLSLPLMFLAMLVVMLTFTYWKRHWFSIESVRSNPYKMIVKVLKFAFRNRYPGAHFTYTDEEPSRLDYTKEIYGGPFKTEHVENVKTFLRILIIMLALGPLFALEVPIGSVFTIFIEHVIKHKKGDYANCSPRNILLDVSSLKSLMTVLLFPIYVWLIYSVLRQCIPKIFTRIKVGALALILGLMGMFLIELFGHILYSEHHDDGVMCMFREEQQQLGTPSNLSSNLDLPWSAALAPGFLTQAGITVIITTMFEFISAQSPHSMKGLLFGVMFAIQGAFQLFTAVGIRPFSLETIWGTKEMKENPPPVDLDISSLVASPDWLHGLVLFLVAIKRYRYRERQYSSPLLYR